MGKKFWQTDRFKELQKEWAVKLEESGFKDAEDKGKHIGKMLQKAFNCYRTQVPEVIEAKRRYYEILGQKYHDEDFFDAVEKYVIGRRAEGVSLMQIRLELRKEGKKNSIETLRKIVRFYEKKWGIAKKHRSRWDTIKKKMP